MLENLVALVSEAPELFASEGLLAECRTFVRRKDGAPAAANGTHDDRVMAMAIAQEVRRSRPERGPASFVLETGLLAERQYPVRRDS